MKLQIEYVPVDTPFFYILTREPKEEKNRKSGAGAEVHG